MSRQYHDTCEPSYSGYCNLRVYAHICCLRDVDSSPRARKIIGVTLLASKQGKGRYRQRLSGGDGPCIHVRTSIDVRYVDRRTIFRHFPWTHGRH